MPAIASSEAGPTVNAVEESRSGVYGPETTFRWSPSPVEVGAGASVTFASASATVPHGIVWKSVPITPTCEEGAGQVPVGTGKWSTGWKGACTFAQAGTYAFYCSYHGESMAGTVVVNPSGTTTSTTTGSSGGGQTTTTTSPPPPPTPSVEASPLAGVAAQALRLARSQRGASVRGSIAISNAGAGGRIDIDLFAARASLAKAGRTAMVRVGHLARSPLAAGRLAFTVQLSRQARGALRRHRRLALTVRVLVVSKSGRSVQINRSVVERA